MATAEEQRLLKPTDIPLIITSASSSPDTSRKFDQAKEEKNVADKTEESLRRSSHDTGRKKSSMDVDSIKRRDSKSRNVGGSLKYEIGRNKSATNLIGLPAKWSSVRIKGTGYHDSRKSVVKIEPCNGIPNIAKDYANLKSPNPSTAHMKPNIGNVSMNSNEDAEDERRL